MNSHEQLPPYSSPAQAPLPERTDAPRYPQVRTLAAPSRTAGGRALLLVAAAALALLVASLSSARAQSSAAAPGIHVTGTGVVYGEPDTAQLDVGVSTVAEDVKTAMAAADEAMNAVREAVIAAGVAEQDIVTSGLNVWREELTDRDGNPTGTRYRVRHSYSLSVRAVDDVGEVLASAVAAGANEVGGISFTLSDPHALAAEARRLALSDARERAAGLAEAAGVVLGAPSAITELGSQPVAAYRQMAMMDSGGSSVASGQLAVTVTVQVSYALEAGSQ